MPVIFSSLGSGRSAALMNTCIIGAVNVVATFVSIFSVDKFGRRGLFIEGGVQVRCSAAALGDGGPCSACRVAAPACAQQHHGSASPPPPRPHCCPRRCSSA